MIDPAIRTALEQARDRSDHRSVTIRRDHLVHVLEQDENDGKAGRVLAGLYQGQIDDLYWERRARAEDRERLETDRLALRVEMERERADASPFPFLGLWAWPAIVLASVLGSALAFA